MRGAGPLPSLAASALRSELASTLFSSISMAEITCRRAKAHMHAHAHNAAPCLGGGVGASDTCLLELHPQSAPCMRTSESKKGRTRSTQNTRRQTKTAKRAHTEHQRAPCTHKWEQRGERRLHPGAKEAQHTHNQRSAACVVNKDTLRAGKDVSGATVQPETGVEIATVGTNGRDRKVSICSAVSKADRPFIQSVSSAAIDMPISSFSTRGGARARLGAKDKRGLYLDLRKEPHSMQGAGGTSLMQADTVHSIHCTPTCTLLVVSARRAHLRKMKNTSSTMEDVKAPGTSCMATESKALVLCMRMHVSLCTSLSGHTKALPYQPLPQLLALSTH